MVGRWLAPSTRSRSCAPMERRIGFPAMGAERSSRRMGPYPGPGVPTYWVWGPSGGAFDYPFADWRGPTGGWGNP